MPLGSGGSSVRGGSTGRAVLRAGVPAQPRCLSALHLHLPCGGRILPSQGRPQWLYGSARAPCPVAWQIPAGLAASPAAPWRFPCVSVSPSVRSSLLRTGWLTWSWMFSLKKKKKKSIPGRSVKGAECSEPQQGCRLVLAALNSPGSEPAVPNSVGHAVLWVSDHPDRVVC